MSDSADLQAVPELANGTWPAARRNSGPASGCRRKHPVHIMETHAPAWRGVARLPRLAGRGLVLVYRYTLAPLIGPRCRHLPSCSEYADESIARFGLWPGGWMALARVARCHPWGTSGLDFVPGALP